MGPTTQPDFHNPHSQRSHRRGADTHIGGYIPGAHIASFWAGRTEKGTVAVTCFLDMDVGLIYAFLRQQDLTILWNGVVGI